MNISKQDFINSYNIKLDESWKLFFNSQGFNKTSTTLSKNFISTIYFIFQSGFSDGVHFVMEESKNLNIPESPNEISKWENILNNCWTKFSTSNNVISANNISTNIENFTFTAGYMYGAKFLTEKLDPSITPIKK